MSRTLRRLVAGTLAAAALTAFASTAQATVTCMRIDMPAGRPDLYVCF